MSTVVQSLHRVAAHSLLGVFALYLIACSNNQTRPVRYTDVISTKTERDKACEEFGARHREHLGTDSRTDKIIDFYSEKIDTCVEARESQIENSFVVVDISGEFIKPMLEAPGDMGQGIFDCDSSGVDHTLIDKVREHRGYVDKVPYKEYMDDFQGGLPRTAKSAPKMLTRSDCEQWFKKELGELR
jgi:hypothetical protein